MKIEKMSFANAQKLTRKEMKSVMAGSGTGGCTNYGGCSTGCGTYSGGEYISCNYCCYA